MNLEPVTETPYVFPAVASSLSRFRPGEVINLTIAGSHGDTTPVRWAEVGGDLMVHPGDVMALSGAVTPVDHGGADVP